MRKSAVRGINQGRIGKQDIWFSDGFYLLRPRAVPRVCPAHRPVKRDIPQNLRLNLLRTENMADTVMDDENKPELQGIQLPFRGKGLLLNHFSP